MTRLEEVQIEIDRLEIIIESYEIEQEEDGLSREDEDSLEMLYMDLNNQLYIRMELKEQ